MNLCPEFPRCGMDVPCAEELLGRGSLRQPGAIQDVVVSQSHPLVSEWPDALLVSAALISDLSRGPSIASAARRRRQQVPVPVRVRKKTRQFSSGRV